MWILIYFTTENGPKFWPSRLKWSKSREHFYGRFHRPLALLIQHWTLLSSAVQVRSLYCTCEMLCLTMIYKKSSPIEMSRTPIKIFSNKRSLQKTVFFLVHTWVASKCLCILNQQRKKITFTIDGLSPLYSWKSKKKFKVFPVL